MHADEAAGWDKLHARFLTKRINHSESYSDGEACTNQAESYFARLRRAEMGIHHRISGAYLRYYAATSPKSVEVGGAIFEKKHPSPFVRGLTRADISGRRPACF